MKMIMFNLKQTCHFYKEKFSLELPWKVITGLTGNQNYITKFSNMIGYYQPDLSTDRSCL